VLISDEGYKKQLVELATAITTLQHLLIFLSGIKITAYTWKL
jgi:hypothetical protein